MGRPVPSTRQCRARCGLSEHDVVEFLQRAGGRRVWKRILLVDCQFEDSLGEGLNQLLPTPALRCRVTLIIMWGDQQDGPGEMSVQKNILKVHRSRKCLGMYRVNLVCKVIEKNIHWFLRALYYQPKITHSEPQKSCSKPVAEKVTESCQQICQCRPPPPLPPPPPPPPPPRLLVVPTPKSTFCPTEETWWPGLVIIIAVCCATLVFLFVVVIICYKAIKRKPMRKEENGTSRAEYAMTSSQNNKTVDNNAVV
ncbi:PREDICTED: proline-rich membrane anchor 1 [Charadrius vociferus]|uniref:proline-rich membrane anchor 1 n=1 Tax=Charadrius vociferus TaxID=50402 RepID=UPI0005219014|nr:PREDICTED: proline-rich membrane anchor 1 [Charadrius vociferus]